MTADEVVAELKSLGRESYKSTMLRHGAREPIFGVSVADMKKIQKRVKRDYQLALDLYETGIYDAMYLAGLIADDHKMTKKDLQRWVDQAHVPMLCGYTVAWVAADGPHGREMALKWIESKKETIATAGWATYACLVGVREDDELDMAELKKLLRRVQDTIHAQPDRIRYWMNNFVIAVGAYVAPLTSLAIQTAKAIGKVSVDMGDTDCKVPYAPDYIKKIQDRGSIGKKRKSAKC